MPNDSINATASNNKTRSGRLDAPADAGGMQKARLGAISAPTNLAAESRR